MEYTLYQLLWFFLVYSFLGWLMETAAAAAEKGQLPDRGVLAAPLPPRARTRGGGIWDSKGDAPFAMGAGTAFPR